MTPHATISRLILATGLVHGCSPPEDGTAETSPVVAEDTAPEGDTAQAPAEVDLFDPTLLHAIDLSLEPAWAEGLAQQHRPLLDAVGPGCLDRPPTSPFTWFPATLTAGGTTVQTVGVRKKGFLGSLSTERPSLKVKVDEYGEGPLLHGQRRLTLNNNQQDPSRLRTCLAYHLFDRAGLPAPRCSLAEVTWNDRSLGVYTHVESMKEDFLERAFGDATGDLYELTLTDFREGWLGSVQVKTEATDPAAAPLHALADALTAPDEALQDALSEVVDLDGFLRFWALETLLGHWDGYAGNLNNTYVYRDPTDGLLHFLPWGPDAVLYPEDPASPPLLVKGELARRLYSTPWGRQGYVEALEALLATVWDEDALLAWIDRTAAVAAPAALDAEAHEEAIGALRWLVQTRRARLAPWLTDGGPDLALPPAEVPCIEPLGAVTATLDTTWGTVDGDPFEDGAGTLSAPLGPTAPGPMDAVGALAGETDEGDAVLGVLGLHTGWSALDQVYLTLPLDRVTPGEHGIDVLRHPGVYLRAAPVDAESAQVGLVVGRLVLDAAGTSPGAPVQGRFEGFVLGEEAEDELERALR